MSTADAAATIHRSPATIRRWLRRGWITPAARDPLTGEAFYDSAELDRMALLVQTVRLDRILRLRQRKVTANTS